MKLFESKQSEIVFQLGKNYVLATSLKDAQRKLNSKTLSGIEERPDIKPEDFKQIGWQDHKKK